MELGKQRPIESMEEARDWERLFIGEIKAGRDPRIKPAGKEPAAADLKHVAGFLDAYFERHLRPAGIRSLDTAAGRIKVLKQYLGGSVTRSASPARRPRTRKPSHPVRSERPPCGSLESTRRARAERLRVRNRKRRIRWQLQDRLGVPLLIANGHDAKRAKPGARVDREKLRQIDLHWHDLRHEGACRLLADGVDIRIIQLMLGHASVQQTQRYLNVTDEELRKGLE
jgi:hypothetical protein